MVRMVNSSSFDSLGARNSKREQFTQPAKRDDHRQTTGSPVEAEGACSRDDDGFLMLHTRISTDNSTTTNTTLHQAIEPTASRTEIQSNIIYDNNEKSNTFFGPQDHMATAREDDIIKRSSLYCSVPLDRIKDVLQKINRIGEKKIQKRLLCLYCNRTFVTASLRQKHVDRFHLLRRRRRSSVRQQQRTSESICIYCEKFDEEAFTLKKLFVHLVTTHCAKYFGCLECEIRFPSHVALEEHSIERHGVVKSDEVAIPIENQPLAEVKVLDDSDCVDQQQQETNEIKNKQVITKTNNSKNKKRPIISTKVASKFINRRLTRQQSKMLNTSWKVKEATPKNTKEVVMSKVKTKSTYSTQVRQYPNVDFVFKYKKITDHSIDNLRIGSLTFEDVVFDKAFFNKVKCNIQDNLLNYIDGKLLFSNLTLENRISSFEVPLHTDLENTLSAEQILLDVYLDNVTPVTTILSSTLKEDNDQPLEKSRKKTNLKNDEVHYKYFTRRKYQAILSESRERRDLSKLDMWTQLAIKDRQSKIVNDQRTTKEKIEYAKSEEYRTKLQVEELDRILDQRAPYENLKEEALRTSVLQKLDGSHDEDYLERYLDVQAVLMDILDKVFEEIESFKVPEDECRNLELISTTNQISNFSFNTKTQRDTSNEIPLYLNLERKKEPPPLVSSEIGNNFTEDNFPAVKVTQDKHLVELTGEWTRTKIYVCAACGLKIPSLKQLIDHKNLFHASVWCQHYEFVGSQSELYHHLSIPGLGKVGCIENSSDAKIWRRSEARVCSKCDKRANCLGQLHRHILECGGDESWANERKKNKYRYGSKSRRRRKGLIKLIRFEKKERKPSDKRKLRRRFSGPRSKPSDAESIERMLANLPPKRTVRKIVSLKDGFTRKRNKKLSTDAAILPKTKTNSSKSGIQSNVTNEKNNCNFTNPEPLLVTSKTENKIRVQRRSLKEIARKNKKSVLGEQKTEITNVANNKEILLENKLDKVENNKIATVKSNISKSKSASPTKGKIIANTNKRPVKIISTKLQKANLSKNESNGKGETLKINKTENKQKSLKKNEAGFKFKNCTKKTKTTANKKLQSNASNVSGKVVNFGQKIRKNKRPLPQKLTAPIKEEENLEKPEITKKEPSIRSLINKIFPNLKRKSKSNNGLVAKRFKRSNIDAVSKRNIIEPLVKVRAQKATVRKTSRKVRKPVYDSNFIIGTSNQKSEPNVVSSAEIEDKIPLLLFPQKMPSIEEISVNSQVFFDTKELANCVSVNVEREITDELEKGPTEGDTAPTSSTIDEIKIEKNSRNDIETQECAIIFKDATSGDLTENKKENSCDFKAKLSVNTIGIIPSQIPHQNGTIVAKKKERRRPRNINNCIALLKSKLQVENDSTISIFSDISSPKTDLSGIICEKTFKENLPVLSQSDNNKEYVTFQEKPNENKRDNDKTLVSENINEKVESNNVRFGKVPEIKENSVILTNNLPQQIAVVKVKKPARNKRAMRKFLAKKRSENMKRIHQRKIQMLSSESREENYAKSSDTVLKNSDYENESSEVSCTTKFSQIGEKQRRSTRIKKTQTQTKEVENYFSLNDSQQERKNEETFNCTVNNNDQLENENKLGYYETRKPGSIILDDSFMENCLENLIKKSEEWSLNDNVEKSLANGDIDYQNSSGLFNLNANLQLDDRMYNMESTNGGTNNNKIKTNLEFALVKNAISPFGDINEKFTDVLSVGPDRAQLQIKHKRLRRTSKLRSRSKKDLPLPVVIESNKVVNCEKLDDVFATSVTGSAETASLPESLANTFATADPCSRFGINPKINLRNRSPRKRCVRKSSKTSTEINNPIQNNTLKEISSCDEILMDSLVENLINKNYVSILEKEDTEELCKSTEEMSDAISQSKIISRNDSSNSEDDDVPIIDLLINKNNYCQKGEQDQESLAQTSLSDSEDDLPLSFLAKRNYKKQEPTNENVTNKSIEFDTTEVESDLHQTEATKIGESIIKQDEMVELSVKNEIKTENNEIPEDENVQKEIEADKENERLFGSSAQQKHKSAKSKKRKRSEKTKIKISIINEETIDVISKVENHIRSDNDEKSDHLGKIEDSSKISISITSTNTLKPVQVQSEIDGNKEEYPQNITNTNEFHEDLDSKRNKLSRKISPTVLNENLIKPHTNGFFEIENSTVRSRGKRHHNRGYRKTKKTNKERTKTHLTISIKEVPYLNKIKICKKETRTEESPDYPRITNNLQLDFSNFESDHSSKNEYVVSPIESKRNSLNSESELAGALTDKKISVEIIEDGRCPVEKSAKHEKPLLQNETVQHFGENETESMKKSDNDQGKTFSTSKSKNTRNISCEICMKTFRRSDSLTKHRLTLTHIAKLSELEAEENSKSKEDTKICPEKEDLIETGETSVSKDDLNETDEDKFDTSKLMEDFEDKLKKFSNNDDDLILDLLDLKNSSQNHCQINKVVQEKEPLPCVPLINLDNEVKQVSCLDNDAKQHSPMPSIKCSIYLASDGNESIREKLDKPRLRISSALFAKEDTKQINLIENLAENNSQTKRKLDDQISRKVLNHDEELFLECCSLLKSGSEISGPPKVAVNSADTFFKKINFESTLATDPKKEIGENRRTHSVNSYFSPSLRFYDSDLSNMNLESNQISQNSSVLDSTRNNDSVEGLNNYSDMEVDNSLDSFPNNGNTTISRIYDYSTSFKEFDVKDESTNFNKSQSIKEKDVFFASNFKNLSFSNNNLKNVSAHDSRSSGKGENEQDLLHSDVEENTNSDLRNKVISRFGNLMAKALRNRYKTVTNNTVKRKKQHLDRSNSSSIENQTSIVNGTIKSTSKRILTKGAMKTFEKLEINNSFESSENSSSKPPKENCEEPDRDSRDFIKSNNFGINEPGNEKFSDFQQTNENTFDFGCWSSASYDVYEFEETQDNSTFTKNLSSFRHFKTSKSDFILKKDDSIDDSVMSTKGESDTSRTLPTSTKLKSNKIITKKKCKIMGKIFKNTCKSNAGSIKCISLTDESEDVVEDPPESSTNEQLIQLQEDDLKKNHKMTPEEMDMLFNRLVGVNDVPQEELKEADLNNFDEDLDNLDIPKEKKLKKAPQKIKRKRRRKRNSENSTDEEFNINRTYKKKGKNEVSESGINLEQELKECIGVASRKSQRKCTSGKQNVLVEYWSSDDSMTEMLLKKSLEESKTAGVKVNIINDNDSNGNLNSEDNKEKSSEVIDDFNYENPRTELTAADKSKQSDKSVVEEPLNHVENGCDKNTFQSSGSNEDWSQNSIEADYIKQDEENTANGEWQSALCKSSNVSLNLEVSIVDGKQKKSQKNVSHQQDNNHKKHLNKYKRRKGSKKIQQLENVKKRVRLLEDSETIAKTRQKRSNVDTLYYWSSSSEDEHDVIEVQTYREELDYSNEDRPLQHGWIVGDSPKKLVTMLAQAKGKKVDTHCVKEQRR